MGGKEGGFNVKRKGMWGEGRGARRELGMGSKGSNGEGEVGEIMGKRKYGN